MRLVEGRVDSVFNPGVLLRGICGAATQGDVGTVRVGTERVGTACKCRSNKIACQPCAPPPTQRFEQSRSQPVDKLTASQPWQGTTGPNKPCAACIHLLLWHCSACRILWRDCLTCKPGVLVLLFGRMTASAPLCFSSIILLSPPSRLIHTQNVFTLYFLLFQA